MVDGGALYPARDQDLNAMMPAPMAPLHKRELPGSQESYTSAASSTFSAPQLPSSSSNLSTSTVGDTEITSPPLSKVPSTQKTPAVYTTPQSPSRSRGPDALRVDAANAPRTGDTAASSMIPESPTTQGLKRAADGSLKGSDSTADSPVKHFTGHKRNKSMEAGSNGRIGQLSAQLKTRLSYAMVKVQNKWEKESIDELEERISQQGSPNSMVNRTPGSRPVFDSPSTAERRRRPSAMSENSDLAILSPGQSTPSDFSRSIATTPSSQWRPGPKSTMNAAVNLISVTGSGPGPMLGPAPDFESRRKRRSSTSFHPPPLLGSNQRKHFSDLGAGPRTPATPRAGILRMPSQQAEKDAVDTLLFMSSPNNSGRMSHASADARAQRHDFAPPQRRVMFENHLPGEKAATHLSSSAPSSQSAAYYRAEPSR